MNISEFYDLNKDTIDHILLITITILIAVVFSYSLRKFLGLFINKYAARLKTDPTNFKFLKNSVQFIVYTAAIIFIFNKIPYLKSLGTALFAGAGILAVIVGFASQKAFSNIISGIFILMFKPFRVNDTIEIGVANKGVVEEITLRHTIIRNYENRRIIIPNGIISEETIINSNIMDEKIRMHIVFGISYDSDVNLATRIIQEEAGAHPFFLDNRTKDAKKKGEPPVIVRLIELSDFSVNLKAYVWSTGNDKAYSMKCDLLKSVFERFNEEGIEVPFPYRTIVYKKDLEEQNIEEV